MEIIDRDAVPLNVALTIQTAQNTSVPFYIQIKHRSTALTIQIATHPHPPRPCHRKKLMWIHPVVDLVVGGFVSFFLLH